MQYRKFGSLDWKVSALGFGCMRLPTQAGQIDEAAATQMVHYAIEHGVNYLDSAYVYHGGQSEVFLGKALQGGYRAKVRLATKLPCWSVTAYADFDRLLNEQLHRLQTEQIDFYLLHGLNRERWDKLRALDLFRWAAGALADGRIGHLGFSFHDEYPVFQEIVDGYDRWTMCMIQHNYMNVEHQAGRRGLQYAAGKGLAVMIMEPLLGGRLVLPPPSIQAIWDAAPVKRTPAEWALQWLWHQPEVAGALSGMSTLEQMQQNVAYAERAQVGGLSPEELARVDQVCAQYGRLSSIPCTKCGYCLPCPNGVNIPRVFEIYNQGYMYAKAENARGDYKMWVPQNEWADKCLQCRDCEALCPQSIAISEWMPKVHAVLGAGQPYPD